MNPQEQFFDSNEIESLNEIKITERDLAYFVLRFAIIAVILGIIEGPLKEEWEFRMLQAMVTK
jgi:hypothetical protein